jgi:disulfide bond formation protein DsbB
MMRYSAIPWPWLLLAAAVGLFAGEAVGRFFGNASSFGQTVYRIAVMTGAVTALTLLILPARRPAYLLGAAVCAGLMGWALWLQYGLQLDPCPLCVVQRMIVIAMGVIFLVACLHNPGRIGAAVYAGLACVAGGIGVAVAARHVWIQAQPRGTVASCGMSLDYMLESLPFTDVIGKVFGGSGECAEAGWLFLDLGIPAWTLVFFVAMTVAALALVRRD